MSEETGQRSSNDFREAPGSAERRLPGAVPEIYEFGPYRLEPAERKLLRGTEVVTLTPKAFDTLHLLVRNSGHLLGKEELIRMLWPHSVVEEGNLTNNVFQLRKTLGEEPQYIETVPRKGYRFVGAVRRLPLAERALPEKPPGGETEGPRRSRPTVLAVLAAVLIVVGGTGMYVYSQRTGQRAGGASPTIHSLAVLPLESLSGDKEQEYFADGMTDALITQLAQIGSLRVISRTSAMRFKGSKETLPQIGQDLKVDGIVEGTVARSENRVRITAQLIQASSDEHLWARTYERDLRDILALQDEIARDITEQIRIKLTLKERSLLTQAHPVDPEAYDAYLRGRYWWSKAGAETWKGLDYFQKAIAKDPSYALAYSGVADAYIRLGGGGALSPKEAFPKAKEAAIKALELDPSLAEAHSSMAMATFYNDWDWPGAVDEIKQAIALSPNDATAHARYSGFLAAVGRLAEALREMERARSLDPFSFPSNFTLGVMLDYARRYDEALRQYRRGLEMFPDRFEYYNAIADIYEHQRMFAEAFAARQQALSMQKDPTVSALAEAYKHAGYRGWLLKKIELMEEAPPETIQLRSKESHLDMFKFFGIAYAYTLLNDEARATDYLERAYDGRNPGVLFLQVSPLWDSIRSSPRFRDLVRRIGLPQSLSDQN